MSDVHRTYEEAHRAAVLRARERLAAGADPRDCEVGLWRNPLFDRWLTGCLPRRENRYGWELRCEVVRPGDAL